MLSPGLLPKLFPFYLALDCHLGVKGVGPALLKACPDLATGRPLVHFFRIVTPNISPGYDAICRQSHTVFFLEHLSGKVTLKGEMLETGSGNDAFLHFLCSPVVHELSDLAGMGLSLGDFAIHDSSVDLLILLQTKTSTINDIKRMADRLTREARIRREAENALKAVNEVLEERVDARTRELKRVNERLQAWVKKLEQRNQEISILNSLGEMLQGCSSMAGTLKAVLGAVQQLFPGSTGKMAQYNDRTGMFETCLSWGGAVDCFSQELRREDCTALRSGRMVSCGFRNRCVGCSRRDGAPEKRGVCNPLIVRDKMVGLIHLQYTLDQVESDLKGVEHDQKKAQQELIGAISDPISLAVANLHLQEELRAQSLIDPLTGLFNRRHIDHSLEREISWARRTGTTIALVMLDVDHFKAFNDCHGHQAGDLVLKALGALLKENIRGGDIACRYGGEEFMLILPDASLDGALKRSEDLRSRIEEKLRLRHGGRKLGVVTASIGVAVYPKDGSSGRELVAAADKALYQAKHEGRNQVVAAGRYSFGQTN